MPNAYGTGIPRHEVEALARCLLPAIQKYFESEEGRREYAEWRTRQGLDSNIAMVEGDPRQHRGAAAS